MILFSFLADDEELDAKFQAYQVELLSKICDHVGWNAQPDEPHVTNLLRYVKGLFNYYVSRFLDFS